MAAMADGMLAFLVGAEGQRKNVKILVILCMLQCFFGAGINMEDSWKTCICSLGTCVWEFAFGGYGNYFALSFYHILFTYWNCIFRCMVNLCIGVLLIAFHTLFSAKDVLSLNDSYSWAWIYLIWCCIEFLLVIGYLLTHKAKHVGRARWIVRRRFPVKQSRRIWRWHRVCLIAICLFASIPCLRLSQILLKMALRLVRWSKKTVGLNGVLAGGAKNESNVDSSLLRGLQQLLLQHSNAQSSSHNDAPRAVSQQDSVESRLLQALKALVQRAEKQPAGLVDRLQTLVNQACTDKFRGPSKSKKRIRRRAKEDSSGAGGQLPNKPPPGRAPDRSTKPLGNRPAKESWSEVVRRGPLKPKASAVYELDPAKWEIGDITKKETLLSQLQNGKVPSGKVVILSDVADLALIRKTLQAHGLQVSIAALLPEDIDLKPIELSQRTSQWVRCQGKASLRTFQVVALQDKLPILPDQNPIKVAKAPTQPENLATFRFVVVQSLIPAPAWKVWLSKPAAQAKEWCSGDKYHSSFAWRRTSINTETVLEGVVKICKDAIETVSKHSGHAGVFLERSKEEVPRRQPVQWEQRLPDEADLAYYQRMCASKRPLAYRKGGGAFLGFRDSEVQRQPRLWHITGVPPLWGEAELVELLSESTASQIEVFSGPRRRKGGFWKVKMLCPFDDGSGAHSIAVDDSVILLSYFVAPQTKPVSKFVSPGSLRQARPQKMFGDAATQLAMPPTEPQPMQDEATSEENKRKAVAGSTLPSAKVQKKDPFELIECGGHGKCGFNSVAVGMALQNNKDRDRTIADASHLGAQLRVTLNSYFERRGHLASHFEPNSSTEKQCDGPVPQTWEAYVKAVLRPGFWCDALCLLGLARRLQQRFVVIMWNPEQGAWERKATIGTKKGAPIVLALRNSHYQLVQPWPGQSFPDDWLHAKEDLDVHLVDLTGGMPASSRASWIPPSTVAKSPSRASWIPPSSTAPIKSPSTGSRKLKVSGSIRSCQTPGARPASIRSLQYGPAVACNKLWWRCPACPFQLEHRTGDRLHNSQLTKRKRDHLKFVHNAPFVKHTRGDPSGVANQTASRRQNAICTYLKALPWFHKQKWELAHKMCGKPDNRTFVKGKGRPPPLQDKCMHCKQSIRLDHVPRTLCVDHPDQKGRTRAERRSFLFHRIHAGLEPVVAMRTKLFQQERAKFQPHTSQMRAAQISRAQSLNGKRPNWKSKVDQVKDYVPMHMCSDISTFNDRRNSQTVASKRKLSG